MASMLQRFYDKTEWSTNQFFEGTPCLLWTASRYPEGYGQAWNGERRILAHKLAWEEAFGPPPEKDEDENCLVLDHQCHEPGGTCPGGKQCVHRPCVNLAHIDLVTHRDNTLRGSAPSMVVFHTKVCGKGHDLTPDNVYVLKSGAVRCRTCQRDARLRSAQLHPRIRRST